jgi:hypothetical protein
MSAVPAVTAQDLELERAELLPARETLCVSRLYPCQPLPCQPPHCPPPCYPGNPVIYHPGPICA